MKCLHKYHDPENCPEIIMEIGQELIAQGLLLRELDQTAFVNETKMEHNPMWPVILLRTGKVINRMQEITHLDDFL